MNELQLKYGVNPNQQPARLYMRDDGTLPVEVLNGRPGYINFLDALNAYALVHELRGATGLPSAASFKHVSPAGAAIGLPLDDVERRAYFAPDGELSPLASAYARARGADRVCSYGDWTALSDVCDEDTARVLSPEFSDGVIAPGYTPEALELLRRKRKGAYSVVRVDPDYTPGAVERRDVYGVTFEQGRNALVVTPAMLDNVVTRADTLPDDAKRDLVVALLTLKYTQSNSVALAYGGGAIGVGAGQQSRIHCTRLACDKADRWRLRRHPKTLTLRFRADVPRPVRDNAIEAYVSGEYVEHGLFDAPPDALTYAERREWLAVGGVSLASDAFFPFGDSVERAAKSGVTYIAQPGGSVRDADVIAACDRLGITMALTGIRLFHH